MKRGLIAAAVVAFAAGSAVAAAAFYALAPAGTAKPPAHPAWTEVQWPFPVDEWGTGKAFHCAAADCGAAVNVYLRAKIGFCDCVNGVADDNELDRLSDFGLMGGPVATIDGGHPISIGWMKGRSRPYAITDGARAKTSAFAIAFNDHCDAMVATVVFRHDQPAMIEPSVLRFLNGKTVLDWTTARLAQ